MLVERLTVFETFHISTTQTDEKLGIRQDSVQIRSRSHQRFDQDFNIIDDRSTQAPQVSTTSLQSYDKAL